MIRSLARLTAAALIIASAAAFATGAALERHSEAAGHAAEKTVAASPASPSAASPGGDTGQDRPQATPSPTRAAAGPDGDSGHDQASTSTAAPPASNSPGSGHDPGTGHENGRAAAATETQEHPELLFGNNLESAALTAAAVTVSVLLAAAIMTLGMPWLAGMIAAAMLAFTALDIREIIFQATRSHPGLAAAATAVALLHLLAALATIHVARTGPAHRHGTTADHT